MVMVVPRKVANAAGQRVLARRIPMIVAMGGPTRRVVLNAISMRNTVLKANEFENFGDASLFDFNSEGVLLFTFDVDGVESAGDDYEDVLFAS